jgi:hypothetical protein
MYLLHLNSFILRNKNTTIRDYKYARKAFGRYTKSKAAK